MTDKMQITLLIPTDGSGQAQIIGRKGDAAVFKQFDFADQHDMAEQIYATAWELAEREVEPPVVADVAE